MSDEMIFGWVDDPEAVDNVMKELPFPIFGDVWEPIKDTGKGKCVLLYKVIESVAKTFPMRKQTIGDCVSQGAAYAVDAIKAVDIYLKNEFEEWIAETATEDIYAGSRVQIGGGRIGGGDGSVGAWAADYITKFGALARQKYGNIDLTVYDGNRARQWGAAGRGVPQELIPIAKQHPVQVVSRVDTYEQARDLLANGYAITIASMQGFANRRDAEGFAKPEGQWAHQMSILAIDDEYKRPGVLVQNSWGAWNGGSKRHEQPDGSFWVDAEVIEKRIFSQGDSWAFSGYEGFKPRKLNTRII